MWKTPFRKSGHIYNFEHFNTLLFNLFFCILQKPTSDTIVTAAKIFCKEPLIDYHRSLNEEAARLAENDPSLLTNWDKLLQKAREALLARGKYQFK